MLRLPRRQVIATLVMRPFPPIIVVRWLIIVSYRIGTFTFTFSCVPTYVGSCTVAVGGVNDGGVAQHEGSKEGEGGATVAPFVTGDGAPRNPRLAVPYASLPQLATAAPMLPPTTTAKFPPLCCRGPSPPSSFLPAAAAALSPR